jgi:DNA modification methylase
MRWCCSGAMMNEIKSQDVVEFLRSLPEESVDLVIADPPYGIEKSFGVDEPWTNIEEWAVWCESWLKEMPRILLRTGNLILYGIHNYLCFNQVSLYKLGMRYRRQFIWHYENGFCGNRRLPRATYEPVLWFSREENYFFDEIREPYKSSERLRYKITKNGKTWNPNPNGRIAGDVWAIPTLAGRHFQKERVAHPTQKPLAISERFVRHFCPERGVVAVPFVGSGSECVAAFKHSRQFIGTEINSYFRKLAEQRLEAEGWTAQCPTKSSGEKFAMFPARSEACQTPLSGHAEQTVLSRMK